MASALSDAAGWLPGCFKVRSADGGGCAEHPNRDLASRSPLDFFISAAFPGWFGWAALTGFIVFLSPTIFLLAQTVNSDYLFVLFVALFLLEASNAIQNHDRGSLIRLFLLGMLASMQRYIGVTLNLVLSVDRTALLPATVFEGDCCLQRSNCLPLFRWFFGSAGMSCLEWDRLGVRPEELPDIGTSLGENAQLILRWFIPEKYLSLGATAQGLLIIFLLLGMLAVFSIGQKNGSPFFTPIRTAIFIFVPIYVSLITVSVVNLPGHSHARSVFGAAV